MSRGNLVTGLWVALGVTALCWMASQSSSNAGVPAPELTFPAGSRGLPAHLSDLKGKVVILDIWATWCQPCMMSMPDLERLHNTYASKGLEVIGISTDDEETRGRIPEVTRRLGITYPTPTADSIKGIQDYRTGQLPQVYIIDRRGRIVDQQTGMSPGESLESRVTPLLKD